MRTNELAGMAAREISETVEKIREDKIDELIKKIQNAKKIYVSGAGRSLLIMRCLAMRLMHLGFESYVVGDTTTPAFEKKDLLILGSGSGETGGLILTANKAKIIGGSVCVITIKKESTLGRLADLTIEIPAYTAKVKYKDMKKSVLPSGSLFEESMLVLADTIVVPLAKEKDISFEGEFSRHANLE